MQQTSGNLIKATAPATPPSNENAASRGSGRADEGREPFRSALNEAKSTPDHAEDADAQADRDGSLLPADGKPLPGDDAASVSLDTEVVGYYAPDTTIPLTDPRAGAAVPVYLTSTSGGGAKRTEAYSGMSSERPFPGSARVVGPGGLAGGGAVGIAQDGTTSSGSPGSVASAEVRIEGSLSGRAHSAEHIAQAAITSSQLDDQLGNRRSRLGLGLPGGGSAAQPFGLSGNGSSGQLNLPASLDAGAQTAANQRFSLQSAGESALFDDLSAAFETVGKASGAGAAHTSTTGPSAISVAAPGLSAPTALAAGLTAPAVPSFSVDTPVLDPAWQRAVNERVVWMAGRNLQSAELKLHPAELGPLQVQLSVDDKVVSVSISAAHAQTREALEGAMPKLREMLLDQGMDLGGASVDGGGSESSADAQDERLGHESAVGPGRGEDDASADAGSAGTLAAATATDRGVDLFA